MSQTIAMTDKQHVSAGLTILDRDGQPFTTLPSGGSAVFSSDDPTVADFAQDATGLNGDVSSGRVGTATITGTVTLPDGRTFTDTLTVNVTNSDAASANFTVGTPVEEGS